MCMAGQPPARVLNPNGKFLGKGISGVVELLANGHALKSAFPPDDKDCREDIRIEAQIYRRLAERLAGHPVFIKFIAYDCEKRSITMEYIPNGTLRDYLRSSASQDITRRQRTSWIRALVEGLELLHSLDVVHADLLPRNLLLGDGLQLKIADFGYSGIDDTITTAGTDPRFYPVKGNGRGRAPVTSDDDLFALGSCIYEIMTGAVPFNDVETERAQVLVSLRQFPDLVGVDFGAIIRDCWLYQARSAGHIRSLIDRELSRVHRHSEDIQTSSSATA